MAYQSEAALEENLIEQLANDGYERIEIKDYDALIENFRIKLNEFNHKKLEGKPLSDKEFDRVLNKVDGKSIFESAKILRDKIELERDDGKRIYIELMNTREWCKNIYQITHQTSVRGRYENRYDVTLLINGLPMVQIELKRRGLDFVEAFNQIQRYRRHSYRGLFRYIQIFVVSNGVDTKYFANSDGEIYESYTFFWSDEANKRITNLSYFTGAFLEKCHISKMIARYMVINETEKALMVMRPYQVYATEAIVKRALETKNNGYVWHTTGSGKTLTSFKASYILSKEPKIKKVIFLVDRRDLDAQTEQEFNKFLPGSVDQTENTSHLIRQLKNVHKPIIVTTIQKMANALKSPRYEKVLEPYREQRVVFIIDECHRTQFGDMHKYIKNHFENAQYFGFTGTPIFKENANQKGMVTADLFEKCLHTYLIKDAIRDGNVLGFMVDYINTIDQDFKKLDTSKVRAIDTEEVWHAPERMESVAKNIIQNHGRKCSDKGYTSLFTVDSINAATKYYDIFKALDHDLKITGLFTYNPNEDLEDKEEHSRDTQERMIADYNQMYNTNFNTDKFQAFSADLQKRIKKSQIDIVIVVRMLLTGFDAKKLNTLYVDKNLKYHDLLQSYSRTNRIEKKTKPYGNIISYRNLKNETDEAIRRFSNTNDVDDVLMKPYQEYLAKFKGFLEKLYSIARTPEEVDERVLEDDEKLREFVITFRELTRTLVSMQNFENFEFSEEKLGIGEQTYQDYKSKYLTLSDTTGPKEKVSILQDIDFALELMHTDKINVSYIMNLIRKIDLEDEEKKKKDVEDIKKELKRADSEELRYKVELIEEFLDRVIPKLGKDDSIDNSFSEYETEKRNEEIKDFAAELKISPDVLEQIISEYEYSGLLNVEGIMNILNEAGYGIVEKMRLRDRMKGFILDLARKFA